MSSTEIQGCCLYNAKQKTKVFQLFSHHLIKYIHESSEEVLLELLQNPACLEVIQEYSYEVLEIIIMVMNEEHKINRKKINNHCGKVMIFLATHCHANEILLYIVEQIELSAVQPHYQVLFHSLQLCLLRCKNLLKMLDMCVDAITKFLMNLPLPNDGYSKDRNDHIMEEIVLSYVYVNNFIYNTYRNCVPNCDATVESTAIDMKHCIFKLILASFGDNFNFLNISHDTCHFVFHRVLNIFYSEFNIIYLIYLKNNMKVKMSAYHGSTEYLHKYGLSRLNHYYPVINISYVQLSNLSWLILCGEKKNTYFPCIYNPIYVLFSIIQLSNHVIHQNRNQNLILRVLNLLDLVLNINQFSIPMEYIDSIVHDQFMQNILNLVVSSDSVKVQKYVINKIVQYINKFEIKAKYRILQKIVTLNCHVKVIGIAIVLFKDTVAQSYVNNPKDDTEKLFFDNNFQEFISKICYLKDGKDTDLIEISDQLIPTLNFIIFLIIRKRQSNQVMPLLRTSNLEFLKLLNYLVKVQLKEWKTYLDHMDEDLSEDQYFVEKLKPSMKTMSVMPKNQRIFMCHQATNTLFIIQDLIQRICELTNFSVIDNNDI